MLPLELAGRADARTQATEMLQRVGLGERLGHYPRVLSGGEQQRVALARASWSNQRCCWPTNLRAAWTSPPAKR